MRHLLRAENLQLDDSGVVNAGGGSVGDGLRMLKERGPRMIG